VISALRPAIPGVLRCIKWIFLVLHISASSIGRVTLDSSSWSVSTPGSPSLPAQLTITSTLSGMEVSVRSPSIDLTCFSTEKFLSVKWVNTEEPMKPPAPVMKIFRPVSLS